MQLGSVVACVQFGEAFPKRKDIECEYVRFEIVECEIEIE